MSSLATFQLSGNSDFSFITGYGLLLLDDSCHEREIAPLQQRANELALFREKHTTLIEKSLCSDLGKKLSALDPFQSSNQIQGSILCAGIREFENYADTHDGSNTFLALKDFLSAIVDPIHKRGGVLESVTGNYVLAIFGVFPFSCSTPVQSLEAIQMIFNNIESLKQNPRYQGTGAIGIGVATGKISIIADKERPHQPMYAIGSCIDTAFHLGKNTSQGQVIIDLPTYNAAGNYQPLFKKVQLNAFASDVPIPKAFIGDFSNER